MNFKTTIALLVLLIIVGSYFLFVTQRSTPTYEIEKQQQRPAEHGTPLFAADQLPADAVNFVTIEKDDGKVVLTKEGNDWWQIEPVRFALNSWEAQGISNDTAKLRYVEKFKPGQGQRPATEKLALIPKPKVTITLHANVDEKVNKYIIKLGKKLSGHGYVMVNDDPHVYVVGDDLHKRVLDKDVTDWRKTSIDCPKEGQADLVTLLANGKTIQLAKADGNWSLESPYGGRVKRKGVEDLLNDIGRLSINKFIRDQPKDMAIYGLDEPSKIVTIRKPGADNDSATTQPVEGEDTEKKEEDKTEKAPAKVYSLRIGGPVDLKKDYFFATWATGEHGGDAVFSLSKSLVENLDKKVDDLRDPRITPIDKDDVRQLQINATQHGTIHLIRNADRWQFDEAHDPGFSADNNQSSNLIEAITNTEAKSYRANAQPLGDPIATITLGALARPEPDLLKVFTTDDEEKYMVMRNNETTGYLVKKNDLSTAFEPPLALRNRQVLDLEDQKVNRLSISNPDGTAFVFERQISPPTHDKHEKADAATSQPTTQPMPQPSEPGPWKLIGHDSFETSALADLVEELFPLQATKWFGADRSPGQSSHTVQIQSIQADPVTLTVNVKSRVTSATGIDMPFEVKLSLADAVGAEMRDQTVLSFSTTEVDTVSVARNGQTITIRKEDDDYVSGNKMKIDQSAAGGLFDTLAGLRVKRYVSAAKPVAPQITITVELDDGQAHMIAIAKADDPNHTMVLAEQAYALSEDTFKKLTASLIDQEKDEE